MAGGGDVWGLPLLGMASRDIVVTVGENDWLTLNDAAETAGMGMEAYVSWCVRIFALQARPSGGKRVEIPGHVAGGRRASGVDDESESAAWAETFAERLSHRADRNPEV